MARDGTVTVKITGDAKGLHDALGDSDSRLSGFGDKMGGVAKGVGLGFLAMGAAAVPFGIKAVSAASDVNEAFSKVNTIFGTSTGVIDKWAKAAATNIGLSRGAALDAAGSFGNMFTQLGIGKDKAAAMSTGIVDLAADFASFNNADISEVIAAQSAAFRGEYDSLQKFLPLINAASVEQKALAMTGKATTKELTAQDKALAVQKLMLEGAGAAQGDFARTSDGLANKMRILKARGEDFLATVGTALLPIVLKGIDAFMNLGGVLKETLAPIFDTVKVGVSAFKEALDGAGTTTAGGFIGAMSKIGDVIHDLIPVVQEVIGWVQNFVGRFQSGEGEIGASAGKLSAIIGQVKETFASAFAAIRAVVEVAVAIITNLWERFGSTILEFIRGTWNSILEVTRAAFNIIGGVFDLIKAVLTGKWGEAWEAIKRILDGAWDLIFGVVRNALTNVIPTIFGAAQAVLSAAFGLIWNALKTVAADAWEGIKTGASNALGAIVGFFSGIGGRIVEAAGDFLRGIRDQAENAKTWIFGKVNEIVGFFLSIPSRIANVGRDILSKLIPDLPGAGIISGVIGKLPGFAAGGVVPGPAGAPMLAMVHGGETVVPRGGGGAGGGSVNYYSINVSALAPGPAQEAVIAAIKEYERRNGTNWRTG